MTEQTDAPAAGPAYRVLLGTIDDLLGVITGLEGQLAAAKAQWDFFTAPPQLVSYGRASKPFYDPDDGMVGDGPGSKPYDPDDAIHRGRYEITIAPYTPTVTVGDPPAVGSETSRPRYEVNNIFSTEAGDVDPGLKDKAAAALRELGKH